MKLKLNLTKASQHLKSRHSDNNQGHILLVDDEQENLDGLVALLKPAGYQVSYATHPEEALQIAQNHKVDLIISDQRMPVMLGTELLAAIKSYSPDNVRIILTGYTDINDLITCINNGLLYRYLVKPWNQEELLAVVSEGMKKIKIERTLHRLVPEKIWDRLYGGRLEETVSGEGQSVNCVAMFIGIRNFTSISSKLTPSQVFLLLTNLMSALSPNIHQHNGYINQYQGDGVLVIFDNEETYPSDALACATTFEGVIRDLNTESHQFYSLLGDRPLSIGVGMQLGSVILGTIAYLGRLEFTILGDLINIASEVKAITEDLDDIETTCIALASAELIHVAKWSAAQSVGLQRVKTLEQEIELYKL
jgi:CheY-like chemotaxis protein